MSLIAEETGEVEVAGELVCEAGVAAEALAADEAAGEAGGVAGETGQEGSEEPPCMAGFGCACMAGGKACWRATSRPRECVGRCMHGG